MTLQIRAVFIRAPVITKAEEGVNVLAKLSEDEIVAVQQGNILATSFHPELSQDTRWHQYFVDMVKQANLLNKQSSH